MQNCVKDSWKNLKDCLLTRVDVFGKTKGAQVRRDKILW